MSPPSRQSQLLTVLLGDALVMVGQLCAVTVLLLRF